MLPYTFLPEWRVQDPSRSSMGGRENPVRVRESWDEVGPRAASKILTKMHETDRKLLNDLFEAEIRYITTRPYLNGP